MERLLISDVVAVLIFFLNVAACAHVGRILREPRKLRPFSIEYCSAPIAVMTEMTEKTPMVIPNIVRPERNLFTPNEPSAIVIVSLNCIFRNSNIEYRSPKQTFECRNSCLALSNNCAENFH